MEPASVIEPSKPRTGRRPRDQRVRRVGRQVITVNPHLDDPRYRPLVAAFARLAVLTSDSFEFLRARGLVGENGELRWSVETVNRLISNLFKTANALQISPAALGKLRGDKPIDLAAALAEHGNAE